MLVFVVMYQSGCVSCMEGMLFVARGHCRFRLYRPEGAVESVAGVDKMSMVLVKGLSKGGVYVSKEELNPW